jgi:hypothetical protein
MPKIVELIGCVYNYYNDVLEQIEYIGAAKNYKADAYVCVATLPNDSNYVITNESNTCEFYIIKADNSILNDFSINDWIYGEEPSIPVLATSMYGKPTVTYYSDEALTVEVTELTSLTPAGTYYAKVVTPSGDNFISVTKVYTFTIEEGNE